MSCRLVVKWLRWVGIAAIVSLAAPTVSWAQQFGTPSCGSSDCASCPSGCQRTHCPPMFHYCYERPPCIHWQCGCPHPICNPCDLPHFGYYEPCWSPWPFPANLAHCPTPPPADFVNLAPNTNPNYTGPRTPGSSLPVIPPTPGTGPLTPPPGAGPLTPPPISGGPMDLQTPRIYNTPPR